METHHLPTRPPASDPRVAQASLALVFEGDSGSAVLDADWTSEHRSELMRRIQNEILERVGERFLDRWSSFTVPLNDAGVTEEENIRDTIRREFQAFNDQSKSFCIVLADDANALPSHVEYCWIGDRVICKHRYVVEMLEYGPEGVGQAWQIRYKPDGVRRTFTARMSVTLTWEARRKPAPGGLQC
ncbi:MAG: hypothetical protein GY711_09775 [bacterium]|nr:hypothetical protein [bacterium]